VQKILQNIPANIQKVELGNKKEEKKKAKK
jgi:hypothetical protein